jgi:hypothetical protein
MLSSSDKGSSSGEKGTKLKTSSELVLKITNFVFI